MIRHPTVQMSWDNFVRYKNNVIVCDCRSRSNGTLDEGAIASTTSEENMNIESSLSLKGQVTIIGNGEYMLYIASPDVQTVRGLVDCHMHLSDLPMHDTTRDLILLNQSRLSQQELK